MNKNLKALGLTLVVSLGAVASAMAAPRMALPMPRDARGNPAPLIYSSSRINDAAEHLVCSGKCILGAILMGTGPATTTLQVRDTAAADGAGSNIALGPVKFANPNTEPSNNPVRLPLLFSNGISVQLSAASSGEVVTVEYIDLD